MKTFERFKFIIYAVLLFSLSFLKIHNLDCFIYNKKIVIFYDIILCLFILSILFFVDKFLMKKLDSSNRKIFKSYFFKNFLFQFLTAIFLVVILLIFFEIFHYIGYGKFNTEYLHNIIAFKADNGKCFIENFKGTKGLFYSLLSVNAVYIEFILEFVPLVILIIFISPRKSNN